MACEIKPVGMGAKACKEDYAGTGMLAYLFFSEDVDTTAEALVEDEATPSYKKFALKTGKKIFPIRLKQQANKVTAKGIGDTGGFENVAAIEINKDLETLAVVERTVQLKPCGALIRRPGLNKGCYILWNPTCDTKFEFSTDSGDTYNSAKGSKWTITSAPMTYDSMYIPEEVFAALTLAEEVVTPPSGT